jgi:Brp/Blh family beta-carotene 15,15'-monooxygenase
MTSWDIAALLAIGLLGVPHGSFDAAIARRSGWQINNLFSWIEFHIVYLLLAIAVTILWWWFPLGSLSVFLLLSGLHFGASDIVDSGSDYLPWVAHGGNFHTQEVLQLFSFLTSAEAAQQLLNALSVIFVLWVISCVSYCIFTYHNKQYRKPLLNLFALIVIVILLPPLVSFAVYFCFWHSRGHVVRLWKSLPANARYGATREALIYTLLAWGAGLALFFYISGNTTEILFKLTFIGLAALTLPHMILVDLLDKRREST